MLRLFAFVLAKYLAIAATEVTPEASSFAPLLILSACSFSQFRYDRNERLALQILFLIQICSFYNSDNIKSWRFKICQCIAIGFKIRFDRILFQ